ncbi:MAG: hypothetical protein COV72_05405 [Candidatus Omnitrophica bacterium CG11_big_fil_rev_8_21_14_0_20_42_13]|uniref:Uncharacterized protein n=1 Tax=Candidatus Ghiorseimicrobium undicola TaxID=1974746 RepID=A0A2H0LXA1_9BACT|nr:MAG: hypothetical protein COV72_05405 [Candidatus Omnitrophica bacterium CG11_big_fil_rev_8_21_14_0_20_42_13]
MKALLVIIRLLFFYFFFVLFFRMALAWVMRHFIKKTAGKNKNRPQHKKTEFYSQEITDAEFKEL